MKLTQTQREILQLRAGGQSSKEIGFCRRISHKTVADHLRAIRERTGIFDVALLTQFALAAGLIKNQFEGKQRLT